MTHFSAYSKYSVLDFISLELKATRIVFAKIAVAWYLKSIKYTNQ